MLRFLISPVLDEAAPGNPFSPWETPVQLLDALGPKLALPQLDETSGQRARRALTLRRRLISEAPSEAAAGLATIWQKLQQLERLETADRIATYAALSTAPLDPAAEHWRGQLLLASLRVERYPFDLASLARLRAERATVLPGWKGPTSEELINARQRLFEQETSPARRARKELGEQIALDELLQAAPRRELTAAELELVAADADAAERFDAAAAAVGGLPEVELKALLEEEAQALKEDQDAANARAVPESGYAQLSVGAGLASGGIGFLRVRPALLAEELGDQRLHGFGPRTEVHFFEGTIDLGFSPRTSVQRGALTLLAVRGLKENGWGWGGGIDYRYQDRTHEVLTQVERLWSIVGDERLTNFVLASVGLRLGVREQAGASGVAGAKIGLTVRIQLPRSFGNALHLDGEYAPQLGLAANGARFEHRLAARSRLTIRLGVLGPFAFSTRADAELNWTVGASPELVGVVGVQLD